MQACEFVFERGTLLAPGFHLRLGAVRAGLEVDEGFFESCGELLLSEEVLLDRADTSFLFLELLRHGGCWLM